MKHEPAPTPKGMKEIAFLTRWMDSKFAIPGTNFRFGLDGLLGLIPGVGDLSTFAVSGYLVLMMAKNGASGYVLSRMIFNIVIDLLLGTIPIIGDLFDFVHKANVKNMKLAEEYYTEGRHRGIAMKLVIPIVIVLLVLLAAVIWGLYKLISAIF